MAPTPFKKFRHRELAQQNADTANAGMVAATTMPVSPLLAAFNIDRSMLLLLRLLTEEVSAVAAEEAFSWFAFPFPRFLRAWASASTAAFGMGAAGGGVD